MVLFFCSNRFRSSLFWFSDFIFGPRASKQSGKKRRKGLTLLLSILIHGRAWMDGHGEGDKLFSCDSQTWRKTRRGPIFFHPPFCFWQQDTGQKLRKFWYNCHFCVLYDVSVSLSEMCRSRFIAGWYSPVWGRKISTHIVIPLTWPFLPLFTLKSFFSLSLSRKLGKRPVCSLFYLCSKNLFSTFAFRSTLQALFDIPMQWIWMWILLPIYWAAHNWWGVHTEKKCDHFPWEYTTGQLNQRASTKIWEQLKPNF